MMNKEKTFKALLIKTEDVKAIYQYLIDQPCSGFFLRELDCLHLSNPKNMCKRCYLLKILSDSIDTINNE